MKKPLKYLAIAVLGYLTVNCAFLILWTGEDGPPESMQGMWRDAEMSRDCDLCVVKGTCDIEISEMLLHYVESYEEEWRSNECSKKGWNGQSCVVKNIMSYTGSTSSERRYESSTIIATLSDELYYTVDNEDFYKLTVANKSTGESRDYLPIHNKLVVGGSGTHCDKEYTKILKLSGDCKGRTWSGAQGQSRTEACAALCEKQPSEWACNPEIEPTE
jgi:hypothetical protein